METTYREYISIPRLRLQQPGSQTEIVKPGWWYFTVLNEHEEAPEVRFLELSLTRSLMEDSNKGLSGPLCFSTDMITPHPKARIPQATYCEQCQYSQYKSEQTWCAVSYRVLGVRTKDLVPFCVYFRGLARKEFRGFLSHARLKLQGRRPLSDLVVLLGSVKKKTEKGMVYVPTFAFSLSETPREITDNIGWYRSLLTHSEQGGEQ